MISPLDNTKRYRAKVRSMLAANFGDDPNEFVEVVSSTETPDSSYGLQHWLDENGTSFGQITLDNPFYKLFDIEEVSDSEEGEA